MSYCEVLCWIRSLSKNVYIPNVATMQISTWDLRRHSPWHTTPVKHSFSGVLWSLATTCNSDLCLLFLSQLEAKKWKTKSLTRSLRLASTSYVPSNFQTCKSIWEKDKKVDSLAEHAAVCSCRRLFFCRRRLLYLNQTQISCGVGWKLAPPRPPSHTPFSPFPLPLSILAFALPIHPLLLTFSPFLLYSSSSSSWGFLPRAEQSGFVCSPFSLPAVGCVQDVPWAPNGGLCRPGNTSTHKQAIKSAFKGRVLRPLFVCGFTCRGICYKFVPDGFGKHSKLF